MNAAGSAWLSECWKPCPELPRHEREEKRKADRAERREIEERTLVNTSPTESPEMSTGCAEIGGREAS